MKKIFILIFLCLSQVAQYPGAALAKPLYADRKGDQHISDLVLLCKVWGMLKYHHPAVTKGQYNWDQELIKLLPSYEAVRNKVERNQVLLNLVKALGRVSKGTPFPDSLLRDVKMKPDYTWVSQKSLGMQLADLLTQVSHYHDTTEQHYLKYLAEDNIVLPSFVNEEPYAQMALPDPQYRLLAVYRYWNIIEYWYPYKYLAKQNWNKCLPIFIQDALAANTEAAYVRFIQKMVGTIKDSHATVTAQKVEMLKGRWFLPLRVQFIENQAVVTSIDAKLPAAALRVGEVIKEVDGVPVSTFVHRQRPYVSASNEAVVLREVARLLVRSDDSVSHLKVAALDGKVRQCTLSNIPFARATLAPVYNFPYQRDSSCFMLTNGVLYVNPGRFTNNQVAWVKQHLPAAKGLVLDARQYPRTGAGAVFNLLQSCLLSGKGPMCKFSSAVKGFPGLFRFAPPFVIGETNTNYYRGRVIILVDENTQSTSEFLTMGYQLAPGALVVGSTTAGADGNVTYPFQLPGGIVTKITGLGVYYPDGKETQQIGIVAKVKVTPTLTGFRAGKDELLDKAIQIILTEKSN
ncbi:S41 family peptidase [Mucilaginibacter sp. CSA2-8R]|uniref:S41 family peptidase n=1 Tax=Mucilaginibacter sp. CSA2-8R TaxID=3141542 RepID=UPI00315D9B34